MSSDLDLHSNGGQVVPWTPDDQPLQPVADDWNDTPVDYLADHSLTAPSGALQPQVEQIFSQLAGVFLNDMTALAMPYAQIQNSLAWFRESLANPPTGRQPRNHGYQLHEHAADELFNAFAVQAKRWGMSQQHMTNLCWWITQLEKKLEQDGAGPVSQPRMATSSADPLDSLSDADYERVVQINEQAKAKTTAALQRRWGQAYKQNLAAAQELLANLPAADQAFLSQYNPHTWVSGLNEEKTILGLHSMAIGSNSLPNGAAIQSEIASIENVMRTNRKAYNKDLRLQARLRTLYDLRG